MGPPSLPPNWLRWSAGGSLPRPAGRVNDSAIAAVLRRIGVGQHLKFVDGFDTPSAVPSPPSLVHGSKTRHVLIVEKVGLPLRTRPSNRILRSVTEECAPEPGAPCGIWVPPGCKVLREVAAIQWQVSNLFRLTGEPTEVDGVSTCQT